MQLAQDGLPAKPLSLHEFRKRRRPLRNVNREVREKLTRLDRLALWITNHVGTMGFFLTILAWTVIWLGWNFLAPESLKFDQPMSFVFWLFLSNLIQARAEHDLEINIKAEQEIEVILHHLEHQNEILMAMLGKLGVDVSQALAQTRR